MGWVGSILIFERKINSKTAFMLSTKLLQMFCYSYHRKRKLLLKLQLRYFRSEETL